VRKGIPDKFGREEWAAIVLTHEFHQHVGIYTVLGAKMGVRAREALNAPTRNVMVEMETGPDQPMACVADGVQASIGSTYAQNLIAMPTVNKPVVSGVFTYRDASVRVRLKEEYQARIERFIVEALMKYPALSPQYFATIEDASYSVWAEFDRKEIFDVTPL
jgi:pyrimidine-specific ribonucleoside hydrolase